MNTQTIFDYTGGRNNYVVDYERNTIVLEGSVLKASKFPIRDISVITVPGQDERRRMYHGGYEKYFEEMPVITQYDDSDGIQFKSKIGRSVMTDLAGKIIADSWTDTLTPADNEFARSIIGMETPRLIGNEYKEGAEFVVAHWGRGFTSPVHGHSPGYLHEEILSGKVRVNSYRMIDANSNIVRLVSTEIHERGTLISKYAEPENYKSKRSAFIHNFVAVTPAHTLHYLPEHTRDGRDNRFEIQHFEDYYYLGTDDVEQVTAEQAMNSFNGSVILVRSSNVPEYGDHYIVITGRPVVKEHGIRPQETAISAPNAGILLSKFEEHQGLVLLKLTPSVQKHFHEFHGITMKENEVIMPEQKSIPLN